MQEGKSKIILQAIIFIVAFAVAFLATKYFLNK